MKPVHLTWLLSRAGGGIPPAVDALAAAQRRAGVEATVAGLRDPRDATLVGSSTPIILGDVTGPLALGFAPRLGASLRAARFDLLHLHGLFTWASRIAFEWGRRTGRPVVIAPHGMLDPWALANSAWKKRLFRFFVEDANLRRAACFHALAHSEAADIRRLGLRQPIAVVPNGFDTSTVPASPDRSAFGRAHPSAVGRRILLFLGRVHPKKGLLPLVHAWAMLARDRTASAREWMLAVAGPDQVGHRSEVERRVRALGIEEDVLFTGELHGAQKEAALAAAEAFVLSSVSEGLPMAVLEALAWRLPVVVSHACHVDVEAAGAGLVCEPEAASIASRLRTLRESTSADLRAMGERGRALVERRYSWSRAARDLDEVYRWLEGGGVPPGVVAGTQPS